MALKLQEYINVDTKNKILVVDDEVTISHMLSELLTAEGYVVDLAVDGLEAVKRLNNTFVYDLIILDVNMPRMDGITLCRNIMKKFPALKERFLFLTGNLTEEAAIFFKENDCKYLVKPFQILDFLNQINSISMLDKVGKKIAVESRELTQSDKRAEKRFHWSAYCLIFNAGKYSSTPLGAKTQDISQNGVKIRHIGEPLSLGEAIKIHIMSLDLRVDAMVMWSKSTNGIDTLAGLRFVKPIQLPSSVSSVSI